jgi:hypothetical protein
LGLLGNWKWLQRRRQRLAERKRDANRDATVLRPIDAERLEDRVLFNAAPIDMAALQDLEGGDHSGAIQQAIDALAAIAHSQNSLASIPPPPDTSTIDFTLDLDSHTHVDADFAQQADATDAHPATLAPQESFAVLFEPRNDSDEIDHSAVDSADEPPPGTSFDGDATDTRTELREIVFIDRSVEDYETLVNDLQSASSVDRFEIVFIDSGEDGIEKITNALAERDDYNAIHIVSHGNDRGIRIGDTWLSGSTLQHFQSEVASWGNSLTESGDLLFYGCDLAESAEGRAFLDSVGALCDCDVASHADLPVDADLGDGADPSDLLQFATDDGHVLGFAADSILVASPNHVLDVHFVGANLIDPVAAGSIDSDAPSRSTSQFSSVTYAGLWDGVTAVYESQDGAILKSTYYVDGGLEGNPVDLIQLQYNRDVRLDTQGNLVIEFERGTMTDSAPVAWQDINGQRIFVDVQYELLGNDQVGFEVGDYNRNYQLVIDPTLTWNTFLGGSGTDNAQFIALDGSGNVYVTGNSSATWGSPIQAFSGGGDDAYVAKLDSSGGLVWSTFLGGSGSDLGHWIAVDSSGNVYVSGDSSATWGSPVRAYSSGTDAFAAKLTSSGGLVWNTFLGGSGYDTSWGIGVDGSGNVYVSGDTDATWGTPLRAYSSGTDIYAAKLSSSSGNLTWNTFLGGSGTDVNNGIAVDSAGNAYVGGYSEASWGSPVRAYTSGQDISVIKLSSTGSITWNTFLGGSGTDAGLGIAVDGSGNVYVTGNSTATWGSPIQAINSGTDAAAAKLNSSGSLLWNTFLGGSGTDNGRRITVDGSGNVFVAGSSTATWGSPAQPYSGGTDGFAAELDSSGNRIWNTFIGGSGTDVTNAIAVDSGGNVYVAGNSTASWGSPVRAYSSGQDAYVAKLAPYQTVTVDITADENDGDTSSITNLIATPGGTGISLREAIIAANNTTNVGGPDQIHFNISGSGPHTITLGSALPGITDSVILDGWTEPDFVATPVIEIDANGANSGIDLLAGSAGSTVRGLALHSFTGSSIEIYTGSNVIEGNYIGTDTTGVASGLGSTGNGIAVVSGAGNTIGGTTAQSRNVIVGNSGPGLSMVNAGTIGTVVTGNYIGVGSDGTTVLGNLGAGIALANGTVGNLIGGSAAGAGNLISGNTGDGIEFTTFTGSHNNAVQGNTITANQGDGIRIETASTGNVIGGIAAGEGNTIANNTGNGINILAAGATGNGIRGNSTHSNTSLGIDLGNNGVTGNDVGDGDSGANNLQNTPVLSAFAATDQSTTVNVTGTFNGAASSTIDIDFYSGNILDADPSGSGEGRTYIGTTTIVTDGSGNATINAVLAANVPISRIISAIATDASGNSSEFSGTSITVLSEVSGTVYSDEGITPLANQTVTVAVNGVDTGSAETDGSGFYMLGGLSISNGDVVTVYLEDESADAVLVTISNGTAITANLYQDRLITRNENGAPLTTANLDAAEVVGEDDISNIYSVSGTTLTLQTGKELLIPTGHQLTTSGIANLFHLDIDGAFNAGGNAVTISGSLDNDGTFTTTGTVIFNGTGSQTIDTGGTGTGNDFQNLTINNGSGTLTLVGNSLDVDGALTINGGTFVQGSGLAITAGSLSQTGGTFTGGDSTIDLAQNWTQSNGTFTSTSGDLFVGGNWNHLGGTFNHNSGTVILDGSTRGVSGSTTFYNLSKTVVSADTLTFEASQTQTIAAGGSLTFNGVAGQLLTLASGGVPTFALNVNAAATQNVAYVSVSKSDASSGAAISTTSSVDGGGNLNWLFGPNIVTIDTTSDVSDGDTSSIAALLSSRGADGFISLREAIIAANNTANSGSPDEIRFNIAGAGPHTIDVLSVLPSIVDAVIIDGWTEPDYVAGTPVIELNGASAGAVDGLKLNAGSSGSTIRGLIINRFGDDGIDINSASTGNTIAGNWIGLDNTGTLDFGNGNDGIEVDSANNTFGGTTLAERNVVSGNGGRGFSIFDPTATGNVVLGNYIGTNAAGTAAVGNVDDGIGLTSGANGNTIGGLTAASRNIISGNGQGINISSAGSENNTVIGNYIGTEVTGLIGLGNADDGIQIANASNNIIGGTTAGARNVIAGNVDDGVQINGSSDGNLVQGNYIGVGSDGTTALGNASDGVEINSGATGNAIGGTTVGAGNVIAHNAARGVRITDAGTTGNSINGNSIHSNSNIGIDLAANGVTANDAGDPDTGPNDLQNFPVLVGAFTNASTTVAVSGSLNTTANTTLRIEFFANTSGDEGETYLGSHNVITNASGNASFVESFAANVGVGINITATATNLATGDTSEFSAIRATTAALIVDTTNDVYDGDTSSVTNLLASKGADGFISLREAITATNNTAGINGILLSSGTYFITRTGVAEDFNVNADFDIRDNLIIVGAGAASTFIDGSGAHRVIEVLNSANVGLMGLTITNGYLPSGDGAGVAVRAGTTVTLSESVVLGNVVGGAGGGILNEGTLWVDQVLLWGNTADEGGGLENTGTAFISNSLFTGNGGSTRGGGIQSKDATSNLEVVNTTFSSNGTSGSGGGLYLDFTASLQNVTVTANGGYGVYRQGGTVSVRNSIIAGNFIGDAFGTINSLGNNIIGNTTDSSGWIGSDQQNVSPLMNTLADNGGFTNTHALQGASPAINAGSSTNAPLIDQRGYLRSAGAIDVGAFEYGAGPQNVSIVTVDTTSDVADGDTSSISSLFGNRGADGFISLREAITAANNTTNGVAPDEIHFNIAGAGPHTINILSALPSIIESVVIDGWSEPDFAGTPIIELNGTSAGGTSGLVLQASGTTVRGLVINRFNGVGILLNGVDNSVIAGNYIGTDVSGTSDLGNTGNGITINGGSSNTIGGTTAVERNVISGNDSHGISLQGNATNNTILGNYIGTNAAGTAALGNTNWGVSVNTGGNNNTIGGSTAGARNVISGNSIGIDFTGVGTTLNTVSGNYIGLNAAGTAAIANTNAAFSIISSANANVIGGATSAFRNVIAGAGIDGIRINGANDTQILNNYIGTDATGMLDLGFSQEGVEVLNGDGTIIGANGKGNLISGNDGPGIGLQTGATNTTIQGNLIGTDATGTSGLPNGLDGIQVILGASDTVIGGVGAGQANTIAFNGIDGIVVSGGGTGNQIHGNSIHSNTGEGIDLGGDSVTANDLGDGDSGSNNLQNLPVLNYALTAGGNTTFSGTLNSTASTTFNIDFFSSPTGDPSGNGEGAVYLGSDTVITDGSGNATINTVLATSVTLGHAVSATVTDASNNTSEFALNVSAVTNIVTVDTTSDVADGNTSSIAALLGNKGADGFISLREAILATNNTANVDGLPDEIHFNIAGAGPHTINVLSALPTISDAVVIDGWSEPDYAGTPIIELNGAGAGGGVNGLVLNADNSTIRGLVINRFGNFGIVLSAASNNIIAGNYIGTDVTGSLDLGNAISGLLIDGGSFNMIGGTTAADRNLISGNDSHGIALQHSTANNTILGNYIGTNATGTAALGNFNWGLSIGLGANNNTIGGSTVAARNVISGNRMGIEFSGVGTSNNVVSGNYIGLNATGNAAITNTLEAINIISSAHGNIIGGVTSAHRNVLAGAATDGIRIGGADNTRVLNNYIGTDVTGTIDLGFLEEGIEISNANGTIIGAAGQGNLISGNDGPGIGLQTAATNTIIRGNLIGTDATGTGSLGNTVGGIALVASSATNTVIGGIGAGEGNTIAFNSDDGIVITGNATGTSIRGNSIHSNVQLGIDLDNDGVTPNDVSDWDSGANNLQNNPVLNAFSASDASTTVTVAGTLNSTFNTTIDVDFYSSLLADADPSGSGEGRTYIGSTTVLTDGSGNGTFNVALSANVPAGYIISAIATDPSGNSSEFSGTSITVTNIIVVDTTSDVSDGDTSSISALMGSKGADGFISLREAITAANNTANGGTPDEIHFNIAGSGPHAITMTGVGLPTITDAINIDGTTEPDFAGTPIIVLDGAAASPFASGIELASNGSTIRGLVINGFGVNGIRINNADNNLIVGNYIGVDVTGTIDLGNLQDGIELLNDSSGNTIGGTTAADRNVISGNDENGIELRDPTTSNNVIQGNYIGTNAAGTAVLGNTLVGVSIANPQNNTIGGIAADSGNVIGGNAQGVVVGSPNNVVQGNYIGTNSVGTDLGNTSDGIRINSTASNVTVGGIAVGAGNVIAFNNGNGITITTGSSHEILGNSIHTNNGLAIDLNDDGVTVNDSDDSDGGPNNLLNFPVLTNVFQNGANLDFDFDVDLAAGNYRIEFFDNTSGLEVTGFGEGQLFVGSASIVVTGAVGYESFSTTLTSVTASNVLNITVTATEDLGGGNFGSTSEFGPQFQGAGVVTVTTTSDTSDGDTSSIAALLGNRGADGSISLREAIVATNNTTNIAGTPDTIHFNIAGAGPHTINVLSALPAITEAVIIDGWSEPDFVGTPIIELDGSLAGATHGLDLTANGTTIRGLVINRFSSAGIRLASDTNTVEGNYIGTTVTGLSASANQFGILVNGANNTIGGITAAQRNVISGNVVSGIQIFGGAASGNIVLGNFVGINAAGTASLPNQEGVYITDAPNNTIGGVVAGSANVLSGNSTYGVAIAGASSGSLVVGNVIGTDPSGAIDLGNNLGGIYLSGTSANRIGGTGADEGNLIAFNDGPGIRVPNTGPASVNKTVIGNSIHSNTGLGIDLNADGVTANDIDDADSGANALLNFPVLTNVIQNGANLDIDYVVDLPAGSYRIEFFYNASGLDVSGFGEGQTYVGFANITVTGAAGYETFSTTLTSVTASDVANITVTATVDLGGGNFGNTSEFSPQFQGAGVTTVTTTSDTSDGDTSSIAALLGNRGADSFISLREAIIATNNTANGGSPDEIHFDITGSGPHTIILTSALPNITDAVVIDGWSEPDFAGTPVVAIDGQDSVSFGFHFASGLGSMIRGLVINDFSGNGIVLNAGQTTVIGNYVGVAADGVTSASNNVGVIVQSAGNIIGGSGANEGNVISGNNFAGISLNGATGSTVQNNLIGVAADGSTAVGNGAAGVLVEGGASNNLIGGIIAGQGNVIANNAEGVRLSVLPGTGNSILRNRIYANTELGIDLGNDGITTNDPGDSDTGYNNLQNFPVIDYANSDGAGSINLIGSLNSTASTNYRLEFFASTVTDGSGFGEAERWIGFANVATDGSGNASFDVTLSAVVADGEVLTATATVDLGGGNYGDTSEFSQNILASTINDAPMVLAPGAALNATEQTNLSIHGTGFSVSDVDEANSGALATLSVGEGNITVVVGDSGVTVTAGNGTGTVTLSGTIAQLDNLLTGAGTGTITYLNSSDAPSANTTFTVTVNDQGNTGSDPGLSGDGTSEEGTNSVTINFTATNDDPSDAGSLPTDIAVTEDVSSNVDFSSINLADPDAAVGSLTVTMTTSTGGNLTASSGGGVTVGGSGTGTLTLDGTLAALNTFLDTASNITYLHGTPGTNGNDADTIQVDVTDNGNTGSGGGGTINLGTVNVDIGAVNNAPANTVPGTQSIVEETATAISGLSISDSDAAAGNLTTRLQSTNGSLNVTLSGSATISGGANDSGDLTIQGTVTDINNTLASLLYTGGTDVVGTNADTLTVTTNDLGNTGSGGAMQDVDMIQIDLTAVNDAPVVTAPGASLNATEQTNLSIHGTGFSVSDVDEAGSGALATLSVGEGTITVIVGDSGLTITGGNGTGTVMLSGTIAQIDNLLTGAGTGTITYFNNSDDPSTSTIFLVTVNDQGNTGADPGLTGDAISEEGTNSQVINLTAIVDHLVVVDTTNDITDGDTSSIDALLGNKGADGFVSLREAIIAANNTANGATPDEIHFNIAGAGPHTIQPLSALPSITDTVVIDATTEPDFAGTPVVVVDGSLAGPSVSGLRLLAGSDGSTILGLVIQQFTNFGVDVATSGNTIAGNYVGTDVTGGLDRGNLIGIYVSGNANLIGGSTAADRNVVAGNDDVGIRVTGGDDNLIQGNYVGLNAVGTAAIANANYGVIIDNNADRNVVGTNGDGSNDATEGNVIAGNGTNVSVQAAIDNVVAGNLIGVDAAGTNAIGGGVGVWVTSGATNTRIGTDGDGTSDVIERNVISGHSGNGITMNGGASNNAIVGNSIYNNTGLGIDLNNDGVTANDAGDSDTGANNLQNFPDLVSAASSGGNTTILGTLNSTASTTFDLHFYSSPTADGSGFGEGQVYLGTDSVTTDGSGNVAINTTLIGVSVTNGHVITATATDPTGNTSEFSIAVSVATPNPVLDLDANNSSGQAGADFAVAWAEDGPPVNIADADATLFDPDSPTLDSLTVTITNLLDGAAELLSASTGGTAINASYDSMTGVLSLTGADTVANYQQVLRSVTYDNMLQDPNTTARIVTFVANDGTNDSNVGTTTIILNELNDAPIVNSPGAALNVTEQTALTIQGTGFTVSDVDEAGGGASATLTVGEGTITVVAGNSGVLIAGGNGTGTVMLTGTIAQVNNLLTGAGTGTITYLNGSDAPSASTTLVVTVSDQGNTGAGGPQATGAVAVINIASVNDAPQIDLDANNSSGQTGANFANTFIEDGGPVRIADTDATLSDVDSATLASLQVVLMNQFDGANEVLAATTTGTSITANYTAGVLTLSGVDSVANYQQVLRTITYQNASQNPDTTPRIIEFVANDGTLSSNLATATVNVIRQNDAPVSLPESYSVDNNKTLTIVVPGLLANDSDVDNDPLSVTLISGPATGNLTLNATGSFTYTPNLNFAGTTSFTYVATDGTLSSALTTVSITVVAVAAAPTDPTPAPTPAPAPGPPPTQDPGNSDPDGSSPPPGTPSSPNDPDAENNDNGHTGSGAPGTTNDDSKLKLAPAETTFALNETDDGAAQRVIAEAIRAGSARVGSRSEYLRSGEIGLQRFGSEDLAAPYAEFDLTDVQRGVLWQQLDTLHQQLESSSDRIDHIAGTATVVTAALSTGYVIWALRGSFLLASFLSTVPTWRSLDPLPIIEGNRGAGGKDDDDESLADIAQSRSRKNAESSEQASLSDRG